MRNGWLGGVLLLSLAACGMADESVESTSDLVSSGFPKNFEFGSAIAGFQVDMGCPTVAAAKCEDRNSDWYQWITTPRIVNNPILFMSKNPPSAGPGFYETYDQDIARAKDELGNDGLRLSIEWSRIFPKATWGVEGHDALKSLASADGIAYYHRIFESLKARGMKPFVTVNHYSLPLWVHDGNLCNQSLDDCIAAGKAGWADPNRSRIVNEIAKYAGFLAEEYGGEVDRWATLNEPFSAVVFAGYILSTPARSNPPGLSGPWMRLDGAKTANAAMIEAHAKMYDAIKAADKADADGDGKPSEVGIVYAFSEIAQASNSQGDKEAAEHAEYVLHDMFMDGIVFGRLDENWDLGPGKAPVRQDLVGRTDFIGLNYYFKFTAKKGWFPLSWISPFLDFDPLAPMENTPVGIEAAITRVAKRYGKPIYVSETGTEQKEEAKGAAFVVQTLSGIKSAIKKGADVRGYYFWSLMDNYEWNHGMDMRFGLYAVDPGTKARRLREAGMAYSDIAEKRDVSPALENRYASFFK